MQITPVILLVAGALISLASSFVISIFNSRNLKRQLLSDERKHLRETVVNAALENWKESIRQQETNQGPLTVLPLDVYIIHMLKLADLITDNDLSESNIVEKLEKVDSITDKAFDHIVKKGLPTLKHT